LCLLGAGLAALASACRSAPPPAPAASDDERARTAAAAFLSCFERDGAECRASDATLIPWAALEALALVEGAIPTRIVDELPPALSALRDPALVRRVFIEKLRGGEAWARAGACEVRRVQPVGARALALAQAAGQRIERLGMAETEIGRTVNELAQAAQSLGAARLVEVGCTQTGRSFYLALSPGGDDAGAWRVVALVPEPPPWLHGPGAARAVERVQLAPAEPNVVDPWLPVLEEQL